MSVRLFLAALGAAFCACVSHVVAFECEVGSPQPLKLITWSISASTSGDPVVSVTFVNSSSQLRVRVRDAAIWFEDASGNLLGRVGIPADIDLTPGSEANTTAEMVDGDPNQLLKLDRADVVATLCAKDLVFERS